MAQKTQSPEINSSTDENAECGKEMHFKPKRVANVSWLPLE